MDYRVIQMGRRSKDLHIEAPGVIVNICQLTDAEGRRVTRVDVNADGDRYRAESEWWCVDAGATLGPRGIGVRIVEGAECPTPKEDETT